MLKTIAAAVGLIVVVGGGALLIQKGAHGLSQVSPQTQLAQVADGLAGYWSFDSEGSEGKIGNGKSFSNSSFNTGSDPIKASAATVCAWIKPSATQSAYTPTIFSNGMFVATLFDGSNVLATNNRASTNLSASGISLGNWNHLCVSRTTAGTATIYINGLQKASGNAGAVAAGYNSLYIGNTKEGNQGFIGNIDEVRVYNRVLSATEVQGIYSASGTGTGTTPPPTDVTPPSIPTGLQASVISTSQINLTWSASTDNTAVTGYRIYRNGTQLTTTSNTSYSDTGLTTSTAYSYTIAAYDAAGNASNQSSSVSATTQTTQTSPSTGKFNIGDTVKVTSLIRVRTSPTSINNSNWVQPVSTEQVNATGTVQTGSGYSNPTTADGLVWWYIRYSDGITGWSTETYLATTTNPITPPPSGDTTPPAMPTGFGANADSSTQITLGWEDTAINNHDDFGFTTYRIYRNRVQVGTWSAGVIAYTSYPGPGGPATFGYRYHDGGLTPGTTYTYTIAAYDTAGNTLGQTAPTSATTEAAVTTPPPTDPTIYSFSPTIVGNGRVVCNPTSCRTTVGSSGTLTETPLTNTVFAGWSGACTGTATTCTVTSSSSVTATFNAVVAPATAFPVRYSSNSRYLVDANNTPFPILGRTSWFIVSNSAADYQYYLDDTAAKGYNSIEFHVLNHDPRGNDEPYAGTSPTHSLPFLKTLSGADWGGSLTDSSTTGTPDLTTPNSAYWSHVDALLAYAESKHILVFMFPAYVGYNGGEQGWMQELLRNGTTKVQAYGTWIANRYRNQKNLVWMMGGDKGTSPLAFNSAETAVEQALYNGINSVTGKQSIYYSAEWQSESIGTDQAALGSAMTLNSVYSWSGDVSTQAARAYGYSGSTRPSYLMEEPYDQEGPETNPPALRNPDGTVINPSSIQPVRRFQWTGWLGTIGGYIAGNGYIWQFNPGWKDHLNTAGAQDMARLNTFIKSIPWYNLVPSGFGGIGTIVTGGQGSSNSLGGSNSNYTYVAAAATPTRDLLVAYIPPAHTGSISINMAAAAGVSRARWFDPTNAAYTPITTPLTFTGSMQFTPPGNNSTGQRDWVLVLDRP